MAPSQRNKDLSAITAVIDSAEMELASKTMLTEGLPYAVAEGCSHKYQKQFMDLASGVLATCQTGAAADLAPIEAELKSAESELEALQGAEAEHLKAVEAAVQATEAAEAVKAAAEKEAKQADKEHKESEKDSAAFLKQRKADIEEQARVAAIVEGSLKMLVEGGWDDEDGKNSAVEAVEGLLGNVKADKVVIAAAPDALGQKPGSRAQFDNMVVNEVMRVLPSHAADLVAKLQESEAEEVARTAEILGLWAIADCARDRTAAAAEVVVGKHETQGNAEAELTGGRKRTKAQEKEVSDRRAKHARAQARVAEVEEAVAAVARIAAGAAENGGGAAAEEAA